MPSAILRQRSGGPLAAGPALRGAETKEVTTVADGDSSRRHRAGDRGGGPPRPASSVH